MRNADASDTIGCKRHALVPKRFTFLDDRRWKVIAMGSHQVLIYKAEPHKVSDLTASAFGVVFTLARRHPP
jgi:hypothetical protein